MYVCLFRTAKVIPCRFIYVESRKFTEILHKYSNMLFCLFMMLNMCFVMSLFVFLINVDLELKLKIII